MTTKTKAKVKQKICYGNAPGTNQRWRTRFIMGVFFCIFAGIALRLGQLHLYPSERLLREDAAHTSWRTLNEPRGEILDREEMLLAKDRVAPSIWVDPRKIHDPKRLEEQGAMEAGALAVWLAERLEVPADEILRKFNQRDDEGELMKDVTLKRFIQNMSRDELDAIATAGGGAVGIRNTKNRFYPQGTTASHLLGYVSRDGDRTEGVERHMDEHLRTVPGIVRARLDRRRQFLDSETIEREEAKGGEDVHLTIDTGLQRILERALDRRMEEAEAPRGMGILMDPHTGAILALANRPAFDPNEYSSTTDEMRKNRAVIDVFEPGSAFKIVTAAAALQLGLVTPSTMIDCENGGFNPYGHRIKDSHALGIEPFSVCFEQSSNVAMIKVAARLGDERLDEWIRRFGFNARTSGDFGTESVGIYRPVNKWSRLSMGSLPIGQEIAVTMPQLARSFAVIANGGYLVEPHFISHAVDREGNTTYRHDPGERKRIISPATARTMRELCYQVVLHGTGQPAAIDEYRAGGKTGTAQMYRNEEEIARYGGPGYSRTRYTAVFAGFAPVSQPRVVCVIVIPEPMGASHYGGRISGPVFKEVVREALIKMNVPEEPMPTEAETRLMAAKDADMVNDRDLFGFENLAVEELFESFGDADTLELVPVSTDQRYVARGLPNLMGMTKREAKALLAPFGVPWDPRGAGWVVEQHPAPGTPISEVTICSLKFASKTEKVAHAAEQDI